MDQKEVIFTERIKYLETRCDCLETRINKEIENCKIEADLRWKHEATIRDLTERLEQKNKTRHQYYYNERGIEVLEKAWQTLSEMDCILHPHQESPLLKELFVIISEQKELNANYKASK